MLETALFVISIFGSIGLALFVATTVAVALRSAEGGSPKADGTIDLAGTASPIGGRSAAVDQAHWSASISSLHRRLPSPEAAMASLPGESSLSARLVRSLQAARESIKGTRRDATS